MMRRTYLILPLCAALMSGQQLSPEQKQQIDAAIPKKASAKPKKPRRMLVTGLCVRDGKPVRGHPSIAAGGYAIEQLGKRTGAFEAVLSNDVEMFRPDKIKQFDAICFNNTQGVLFEDPALKKSFLDYMAGGGGFVGFHAACVSFVQYPKYDFWPEFGRLLGGTENGGHPWMPNDSFTVKVDDPKSPLNAMFKGRPFEITEEVFQFQEPALRERLHVLLSIDMTRSKPTRKVLPIREKDQDFPMSWIHPEGKGRVYYTALGHNAQLFANAALLEHFLAGIQYALGDLKADARPSAKNAGTEYSFPNSRFRNGGMNTPSPHLSLALAVAAAAPAQDRRNSDIIHTDTRFQAKSYRTLEEWQRRAAHLRKQALSAAGLLPMPEKTPLNAQIFGRIENKDYSIEKVYLETLPGFYLAGNLYRPLGRTGRFPAVAAPHGHAQYGRLEDGPLFSVPRRGINMARQGYVVFGYDMIGYNDTVQIPHVATGRREQLWGLELLGLQTWNSIRVLDFLQSLPDVDPERLGVTGESGGGTQTFMLCAVDDRPKISSPVNMISLIMQGGSPCENAPNLRVGANNVEIASLMAPRPMLMVAATGDWTKNTPREEYPAVKAIYELYGQGDQVETVQFDAPHNYHQGSREAVYKFFAKRVLNDPKWAGYSERNIRQEKLQDLMVFHGRALPAGAVTYPQLVERWIAAARKQNAETKDAEAFRERLRFSIGAEQPEKVESEIADDRIVLTRPGEGDRVPGIWLPKSKTAATLAVHPEGAASAAKTAADGRSLLAIDAFQTGSAVAPRDRSARHFLTFNRTEDANRVQDILTALAFLKQQGVTDVRLVGVGKAAVWATFAAALAKSPLKLEAPLGSFRGTDEDFIRDFFVPGIQRAGGLEAARLLTKGM